MNDLRTHCTVSSSALLMWHCCLIKRAYSGNHNRSRCCIGHATDAPLLKGQLNLHIYSPVRFMDIESVFYLNTRTSSSPAFPVSGLLTQGKCANERASERVSEAFPLKGK